MEMLGVGVTLPLPTCNSSRTLNAFTTFPPPLKLHSNKSCTKNPISPNFNSSSTADLFSLSISNKNHKFYVLASRKYKQDYGLVKMISDDDDDDDYDDDDEEDEEDEEEDEEEEEDVMPFEKMRRWLQNKPTGFGEGKVYDTSVEDKLVEEMGQSRTAQLANMNMLKSNPPENQQQQRQSKPLEVVRRGVQVRVGNLPRKKNIHRDLQLVFKVFPGIINISPAVSGNKKTRDPVCKGFAFLDLESEEAANRFIQMYSKQSISFGKIQKRITIEMKNRPSSSTSVSEQLADNTYTPGLRLSDMGEDTDAGSDMEGLSCDSQEGTLSEGSIGLAATKLIESLDYQPMLSHREEIELDIKHVNMSDTIDQESVRPRNRNNVPTTSSSSSKERQKSKGVPKKQTVKAQSEKALRLKVLGSASRLKIKERSLLTGVLSKYGGKAASASSQET